MRKALGQHHLRRASACGPLVSFLAPTGRDLVEIGAGGGILTGALLAANPRSLVAIELDVAWALRVAAKLRPARLVVADALDFDWNRLRPGSRVAGNLPYNVATAILERLLLSPRWDRAAFLVQLEVAQRLAAAPGSKQYGSLSVLVAARAEARVLGKVAPGAFTPPPKVESAFVGLVPRVVDPRALEPKFPWLVRGVFTHRRKTIANALGHLIGGAAARQALGCADIDPGIRPEQVPLEGWLALSDAVVPT